MGERHFITGDFQSHARYVSDEEYGMIKDNVVRTCVDCVIVNKKGEMLLGKRNVEPCLDWWIIGGAMKPGESFEFSAARNLKRELGLIVDHTRFIHLNVYSFVWVRRREPPQENGCHDVSITMVLFINDQEISGMQPNNEYKEIQWILPEVVVVGDFHPAVKTFAKDLLILPS